jgi:HlyD family secretion protein
LKRGNTKWALLTAATVTVVVVVIFAMPLSGRRPVKLETVTVQRSDVVFMFTEKGIVRAADEYTLMSPVSGNIVSVNVEENHYVQEGQTIATIDTVDLIAERNVHIENIAGYQARIDDEIAQEDNLQDSYRGKIDELTAKLKEVRAEMELSNLSSALNFNQTLEKNIKSLDRQIQIAQENITISEKLVEDYEFLFTLGEVSRNDCDEQYIALLTAENNLAQLMDDKASLEQQLEKINSMYGPLDTDTLNQQLNHERYDAMISQIETQLSAAQKSLEKDVETAMIRYYESLINIENNSIDRVDQLIEECNIVADRSGYITQLLIKNISKIQQYSPICTIMTEIDQTVESYVLASNVLGLSIGDPVDIIFDDRNEERIYKAVISSISNWAEDQISSMGIVEQKVKVIMKLTEAAPELRENFETEVSFTGYHESGVISVPSTAVFQTDGQDYVFAVSDGEAVSTPIEVGK